MQERGEDCISMHDRKTTQCNVAGFFLGKVQKFIEIEIREMYMIVQ